VYDDQGKYEEALQYYLRALEIKEKKLGVDHPDVAGTRKNIAEVYKHQGKNDDEKKEEVDIMPNDSQKTPLFQSDDESMPLARSNKEG
jgi:tetratricopeptide (TPR) repeat protein